MSDDTRHGGWKACAERLGWRYSDDACAWVHREMPMQRTAELACFISGVKTEAECKARNIEARQRDV